MTGKDDTMEWKQIETKWAAMTRRIRADYVSDRIERPVRSTRETTYRDDPHATMAGRMATSSQNPDFNAPELKTASK